MTDFALRVEDVSKKYNIGDTSKGSLGESILNFFRKSKRKTPEDFWALKDINFNVEKGEAIGIIGRNGAGKSTLLKLLSRISYPTSGRIEINGRVSSLLEVGTGFHPELTGKENVFLNGTILGMTRQEIRSKFDEIVAFSGVEKFLDMPVKRYSSGMKVRLAFAVAAHLEPEILIIDEVLAVGDAEFQRKCLGKMEDVTSQGRTVLFVSHNMAAVSNICKRGILLKSGKIERIDKVDNTIRYYLDDYRVTSVTSLQERVDRKGVGDMRFLEIKILDEFHQPTNILLSGQKYNIQLKLKNHVHPLKMDNIVLNVGINNNNENRISLLSNEITGQLLDIYDDVANVNLIIDKLPLSPGTYSLTLFAKAKGKILDWVKNAIYFEVEKGDFFKSGKIPSEDQSLFYIEHSFNFNKRNL